MTKIGILQFIPQLDDAVWGFRGSLEAKLGERPEFMVLDARGRETQCPMLARKLAAGGCDLLFGSLTPAAQALKEAASSQRLPVVFAPVFHPLLAGLVPDENRPGGHVTGVSGRLAAVDRVRSLELLFPPPRRAAVLSFKNDPLSDWDARGLVEALSLRGYHAFLYEASSTTPGPMEQGMLHLLAFSPDLEETQERWISGFLKAQAPLVGCSARSGFLGAVFSIFADHGRCGTIAGEMAAEILQGALPGEMAIRFAGPPCLGFNYYSAGRLGIRIPAALAQDSDIL